MKAEGAFGVFEAEQVQNRGVNVMHVTPVFDRAETQFVRLPKNTSGLHAAAGKPHGEGVDVVIAAGGLAVFAHRCAPEFTAPDHQRVVEQAAGFQVFHQRGAGLVGVLGLGFDSLRQAAVMVPVTMAKLNETHAALGEAAGQKTVVGEG